MLNVPVQCGKKKIAWTLNSVFVQQLGWHSRVDLSDLVSVDVDPAAMKKSLRTCGNGGLFSFSGRFRNKKLGSCRAFATVPNRSVVMRFPNRVVIMTPNNPDAFESEIRRVKKIGAAGRRDEGRGMNDAGRT